MDLTQDILIRVSRFFGKMDLNAVERIKTDEEARRWILAKKSHCDGIWISRFFDKMAHKTDGEARR